MWSREKCLECRDCQDACTGSAISFPDDSLVLDKRKCDLCGACVNACHSQALKLIGKEMTVAQIMQEIEKDTLFYDGSKGGVTFSGGEPLMQPSFLLDLLKACKEIEIHTAVDTCGYANSDILLEISKHVDLFLYDVKVIDDEKHIKFTGVSNKLVLDNLNRLSKIGQKIIVRFALILGVNNDKEDILELGAFVSSLENVEEISILPYHKGGIEKLKRLRKLEDSLFEGHSPTAETISEIERTLKDFGLTTQIGG